MQSINSIIITGATGCVGSALVREAILNGIQVTCIVHSSTNRLSHLPIDEKVKIVRCDLADYSTLTLDGNYDAFIHLSWEKTFGASRDDAEVQTRNIQYTLDAVQLAKRCGCTVFIGAGSQAEYGVQDVDLTSDLPVNPESGYGISKYASGKLSAMLCKHLGIRHCWVRILSVYGPNDGENSLISYVIRRLREGKSPELTKCQQIWDYLYADDAARAMLSIAEKGMDGKIYPLGSGNGRLLYDYIEDIRCLMGSSLEVKYGVKDYYPHQPMHLVADISELTADTGWHPIVAFDEGINNILKGYNKSF